MNIYVINYDAIENANNRSKKITRKRVKKSVETMHVDSLGNSPVKGQAHFTDYVEYVKVPATISKEKTNVETVVEATGCTVQKAEEVLEYAVTCNKNNPVGFSIKAINEGWKLKNKEANGINPRSFNNFEGRSYQYDKLEAMLLGHEDYSEEDIHEVLSNTRSENYISNNSKRFNGVEIGTNVAV